MPKTKRSFRSEKRPASSESSPAYPTFDVGRRSFLRKLGILAAGVAAGGALAACGGRNVEEKEPITFGGVSDAKPATIDAGAPPMPDAGIDIRPPLPDSGVAPMPPDASGGIPDMMPADLDRRDR
jgi:hypothetical protein